MPPPAFHTPTPRVQFLLPSLSTDHPPSASSLHSPQVLIPLILGGITTLTLLAFALYHCVRQDDDHTLETIEKAERLRRRRSSTLGSVLAVKSPREASGRAGRPRSGPLKTGDDDATKAGRSLAGRPSSPGLENAEVDANEDNGLKEVPTGEVAGGACERRASNSGESLAKVTSSGSVIPPGWWLERFQSQKTKKEGEDK